MALKREGRQVDYKSQIGVNRGQGFADLAQASLNRATQFDRTLDKFASETLNAIQNISAREGAKQGELYDIQTEQKTIINPNTGLEEKVKVYSPIQIPKSLRTRTSVEAFEKALYKRYENEILQDLENIAIEESNNAINNNFPLAEFDAVTREKYEAIYENLSDTILEKVARTNGEKLRNSYGSTVNEKYLDRKREGEESYRETNFTTKFDTIKAKLQSNINADEDIFELVDMFQTSLDLGDEWIDGQSIKNILNKLDAYGQLGKIFAYGSYSDTSKMTYSQLAIRSQNLNNIIDILDPVSTVSSINLIDDNGQIRTVTKQEILNYGISQETLESLKIDISQRKTKLDNGLDDLTDITAFAAAINNSSVAGTNFSSLSPIKSGEISATTQGIDILRKGAANFYGVSLNDLQPNQYIEYSVYHANAIPPTVRSMVESAFNNRNYSDFQQLEQSGYLNVLFGNYKRYQDEDGNIKQIPYSVLDSLEFSKSTISNMYEYMALRQTTDLSDQELFQDLNERKRSLDFNADFNTKLSNLNLTKTSLKGLIDNVIADTTDKGFFSSGIASDKLRTALYNNMELEIGVGNYITVDGVKKRVESLVNHTVGGNGLYTVDSYTLGERLESGEYLAINGLNQKYSQPYYLDGKEKNDAAYLEGYIMSLVENTLEYQEDVLSDVKLKFGKNIMLLPVEQVAVKNPRYYLMYVQEGGERDYLQNRDGSIAIFDPLQTGETEYGPMTVLDYLSKINYDKALIAKEEFNNGKNEKQLLRSKKKETLPKGILSVSDYKKFMEDTDIEPRKLFSKEWYDKYLKGKFGLFGNISILPDATYNEWVNNYSVFYKGDSEEERNAIIKDFIKRMTGKKGGEDTTRFERKFD